MSSSKRTQSNTGESSLKEKTDVNSTFTQSKEAISQPSNEPVLKTSEEPIIQLSKEAIKPVSKVIQANEPTSLPSKEPIKKSSKEPANKQSKEPIIPLSKEAIVKPLKEGSQAAAVNTQSNFKSVENVATAKGSKEVISKDQRGKKQKNKSKKKKKAAVGVVGSKEKVSAEKVKQPPPSSTTKNDIIIISKEPISSQQQQQPSKLSMEPSTVVASKEMLQTSSIFGENPSATSLLAVTPTSIVVAVPPKPPIRKISTFPPMIALLCPVITVYILLILLFVFWYLPTIDCYGEQTTSAANVVEKC